MSTFFTPKTFQFLQNLKQNNNRDWFQEHKPTYFSDARDPMLRLITELQRVFRGLSPHIVVDPKPNGGSMFRIYRDTRFSKDKSPYKTHLAARFQHRDATKGAAPGFYLSVHEDGGHVGAGLWRPETKAVAKIRKAIMKDSARWAQVTLEVAVEGERLKRPPRGVPADHQLIEDLKLKEYVSFEKLTKKQVCSPDLPMKYFTICQRMSPLVHFVCDGLKLPW